MRSFTTVDSQAMWMFQLPLLIINNKLTFIHQFLDGNLHRHRGLPRNWWALYKDANAVMIRAALSTLIMEHVLAESQSVYASLGIMMKRLQFR